MGVRIRGLGFGGEGLGIGGVVAREEGVGFRVQGCVGSQGLSGAGCGVEGLEVEGGGWRVEG